MASITEFNEDKWMRIDNAMFGSREFSDMKRADERAVGNERARIREERSNQSKMRMLYRRAVRDNNIQGALAIRESMKNGMGAPGIGGGPDDLRRAQATVRGAEALTRKVAQEDPQGQLYRDETGAFRKSVGDGDKDPLLIDNSRERFAAYGGGQKFGLREDNRIRHELDNVSYFTNRADAVEAERRFGAAGVDRIKAEWEDERIRENARWNRKNNPLWDGNASAMHERALGNNPFDREQVLADADRLETGQVWVSEHKRIRDNRDTVAESAKPSRLITLADNLGKAEDLESRSDFFAGINANRDKMFDKEFPQQRKDEAKARFIQLINGPEGDRFRSIKMAREEADNGLDVKGAKVTGISKEDERFYRDVVGAASALGIPQRDMLARDDFARVRGWKDLGDPSKVTGWLADNHDNFIALRGQERSARSDGNVEQVPKQQQDWMRRYEKVADMFMAQYASSPELRKLARAGKLMGAFGEDRKRDTSAIKDNLDRGAANEEEFRKKVDETRRKAKAARKASKPN